MRRFLSARKVWRVFTSMLQSKLHKLNRSKAIKKPPKSCLNKSGKKVSWSTFSIQPRRKNQKFHLKPSRRVRYHHHHCLQRRPSPVYIDHLFLEPTKNEHAQPSTKEIAASSSRTKISDLFGEQDSTAAGTSNQDGNVNETMHTADDMWESLLLASPQMHGINERAEEFIARFRAEMQLQEMLARR